jgi:opacity protein-like surface antigen
MIVVKMVVMFLFVFVSSALAADNQQNLLSDVLNDTEKAAKIASESFVKKTPQKKEAAQVKTNLPAKKKLADKKNADKAKKVAAEIEAAMQKQMEMDKLDVEVEAAKKQMAKDASANIESTPSPTANVVLPKDEAAEKVWSDKINNILSATSTVKVHERIDKRIARAISPLELDVIIRLSGYRDEEAINPEAGFGMESSNQTGMRPGYSFQVKYMQAALECVPSKSYDKVSLDVYDTDLGKEEIVTGPALIAKLFVVENAKYSLFFGLGIEHVKVNGAFSIGGTDAAKKYNKTAIVYQVGGEYKVTQELSFGANYELSDFRLSNEFEGVPAQILKRRGGFVVTLTYRLLKKP